MFAYYALLSAVLRYTFSLLTVSLRLRVFLTLGSYKNARVFPQKVCVFRVTFYQISAHIIYKAFSKNEMAFFL